MGLPFTEMGKIMEEVHLVAEDTELSLKHANYEICIKYPKKILIRRKICEGKREKLREKSGPEK